MSVNLPRGSIIINGKLYNGQSGGSFYKTGLVSALSGATSVTITDSHINSDSSAIPYSDNGSDTPIPYNSMTLTSGQCVLTFDALETNTSFYLIVMDGSGTSGGGGGLLPHLVITADSNSTVTVVKGQTSITATETSSGIYECNVPDFGTYTINGEVGGESASGELVVDAVMIYEYTLTPPLPQGDTVLPVNDIQTWLECAGITDKSYTTLAEVLADAETFTALLQDSNASDYMARSTAWAKAEGLIPVMTSDTTPSGVASAESVYDSNYPAWHAFDGNSSTSWSNANAITTWLQYQFTEPVRVKRFYAEPSYSESLQAGGLGHYKIQGSNDGTNYTDLYEETLMGDYRTGFKRDIDNDNSYLYYRLICLDTSEIHGSRNGIGIFTLQFFADVDITTDADAMRRVGMYDYCSSALLGNSVWADAIGNSAYFESILGVNVPIMTSNTTPSGEAFGSTLESSSFAYYKAFNRTETDQYDRYSAVNNNEKYIGYRFTSKVCINALYTKSRILPTSSENYNGTISVQGLNDDSEWETIHTYTSSKNANGEQFLCFSNDKAYFSYRLATTEGNGKNGSNVYIFEFYKIQFYGRYEAQTNIIHGATNDLMNIMQNGSTVAVAQAVGNVATFDFSTLNSGVYDFTSTTAKNPSDLSADYSKSIRITPNTTEVYVMPDNCLYWYGYESADLEDISSDNGWTFGTGYTTLTPVTPTRTTNYIDMNADTSKISGVGGKDSITPSKIKSIVEGVRVSSNEYGQMHFNSTKQLSTSYTTRTTITANVPTLLSTDESTSGYFSIYANNNRQSKLYALWHE